VHWQPVQYRTIIYHRAKSYTQYNPEHNNITLTLWRPLLPNAYSCKASCARPGYTVNPSFVIFDIRALWRLALSIILSECQKLQMIPEPSLAHDALQLYAYGNSGRQRVNIWLRALNHSSWYYCTIYGRVKFIKALLSSAIWFNNWHTYYRHICILLMQLGQPEQRYNCSYSWQPHLALRKLTLIYVYKETHARTHTSHG